MEDKLLKEIKNNVGYVWINRPDKKNALDADVWFGLPGVIEELDNIGLFVKKETYKILKNYVKFDHHIPYIYHDLDF